MLRSNEIKKAESSLLTHSLLSFANTKIYSEYIKNKSLQLFFVKILCLENCFSKFIMGKQVP